MGTAVDLSIETGGPEGDICVKGIVRWHKNKEGKSTGCGIEFLDLGSRADRDLADLFKRARSGHQSFD